MKHYTLDEVTDIIKKSPTDTRVYVGCDSISKKKKFTVFITVIVLHYYVEGEGKGGKILPLKVKKVPLVESMRHRLLHETYESTGIAMQLMEHVGDRILEVHLDYSPHSRNKSNTVVQQALGYVKGQGLIAKIKPDAPAASTAADYLGRSGWDTIKPPERKLAV